MDSQNLSEKKLDEELADSLNGSPEPWYTMFTEVFHYRELLYQMILRDIRLRYKQTVMGCGWALFTPIMIVLSGCVVKLAMSKLSGMPIDIMVIAAMSIKAVAWSFFSGGVGGGSGCLLGNINLVTKIYFPREVFPLTCIGTQIFDTIIASLILSLLFIVLGIPITIHWLWIPLLAIELACLTLAIMMLVACANVFYRDVKYLVAVVVSFGIFFTPVFYEPEMFGPRGSQLMMLNPVAPILEGLRLVTIGETRTVTAVEAEEVEMSKEVVYKPISLFQTLYSSDGQILLWTPYYLLYSTILSFGGIFYAWRRFHQLEFIFPEYI